MHTYWQLKLSEDSQNVTGFVKTIHVCTRIEIHFIAYCNSHTHALSRHNNKTCIDKQVSFYRQPVVDPIKPWRTAIIEPVRPLRDVNGVVWGPILSHCMYAWLVVWSGLLWPSVWPAVYIWLGCLCQLASWARPSSPSPSTHPLYVAFLILQAVFKRVNLL